MAANWPSTARGKSKTGQGFMIFILEHRDPVILVSVPHLREMGGATSQGDTKFQNFEDMAMQLHEIHHGQP